MGPVGDAGWTYAHDLGRKARRGQVRRQGEDHLRREASPEGPDAERVIRDLVAQGNKVIFATSFGFGDSMEKVAKDHPEVYFEHATGYKTAPNLRDYEGRFYEDAYLAGVAGRRDDQDATSSASWARSPSPRCSATSTPSRSAPRA